MDRIQQATVIITDKAALKRPPETSLCVMRSFQQQIWGIEPIVRLSVHCARCVGSTVRGWVQWK